MKKYFYKTVLIILIANTMAMLGNFCFFQILSSSSLLMPAAQAATMETRAMTMTSTDVGNTCQKEQPMPATEHRSAATADHQNSLLPCCINDSHDSVADIALSTEFSNLMPATCSAEETRLFAPIAKTAGYQDPFLPPPELLAIRTTVLRR
ncbi:TPA: hypothetical protein DCZ15_00725 [Candidatus Falkowbacteria bacterium]|nr:MAG: hypothetical protein UV95_C0003G0005 [Candidatus Falkowbacteria bacterium GW2011_GWF2_43_32]HBA36378.1 hypothetical protein [Candidatus Falkowbacteria bacterium]